MLLTLLVSGSIAVHASEAKDEKKIDKGLIPGISYLLGFSGNGNETEFDPAKVEKLIAFVDAPKDSSVMYHTEGLLDAKSAYLDYNLSVNMETLLKYCFSPEIPAQSFTPTSLRLSKWISEGGENPPNLYNMLADKTLDLEKPYIFRGTGQATITPDTTTGAYYAYKEKRTLILFKLNGRVVLLSLTRQLGKSTVGKKGLVLGDDHEGNYIYSGVEGLSSSGIGWAKSYMYESASISVYVDAGPGKNKLKCGVLKWLKAGWKNINLVKSHHIYSGLKRYVYGCRPLLESSALPPPEKIAADIAAIQNLPPGKLKAGAASITKGLKQLFDSGEYSGKKPFAKMLENGKYIENLTREEQIAMHVLEYMKQYRQGGSMVSQK